jgi:hypothetical protein
MIAKSLILRGGGVTELSFQKRKKIKLNFEIFFTLFGT